MRKNKAKNKNPKRNYRQRGGSIMVPTEREQSAAEIPEELGDMEDMVLPSEMEATEEEEIPEDEKKSVSWRYDARYRGGAKTRE
jgi:hypothetical protein